MRLTEIRCDRCGMGMDDQVGAGRFLHTTAPNAIGDGEVVDWCRDCAISYRKWLKEEQ